MPEESSSPISQAADLVSKVLGVLAAVLALGGYVLVLGAAILWLRLHQVDLPPEVPVAVAAREELIVLGAKAVAVWLLLAGALAGLAVWIVSGDPTRRRFSAAEAGLALTITLSTLLALSADRDWLLVLPALAGAVAITGALVSWPSLEAVGASLLPSLVGVLLAVLLAELESGNDAATAAGATTIFVILVLATPRLQAWRFRHEANLAAKTRLELEGTTDQPAVKQLLAALAQGTGGRPRLAVLVWTERITVVVVSLLLIGAAAVASQVERGKNFHPALLGLTNGDCLQGTFLVRGSDQIVLAQPSLEDKDSERSRIVAVPTKEVLEVQIYATASEGEELSRDPKCEKSLDRMVAPAPKEPE